MQNIGIKEYIQKLNELFIEITGGSYANVETGEIFTKAEVTKFIKLKLEDYNKLYLASVRSEAFENGIELDQSLINSRSKKKKSNKVKDRYDGGDFNMIYRERLGDIVALKLNISEKGVYYSLGELLTYPTNTVMINGDIPTFEALGKYIGLSDRNLRKYIHKLEDVNLIKLVKVGYKKAIVFNPEYYATGKDLDIDTLRLFNLVECDDDKVNEYLNI
ncbi:hypothetical protein [Clostridium cuniculi]|uniref:hypothetical protein n=1 Tax=Clostridium cuniculi TaxID=2548455 RepID=UPI0010548B0F|nr:hypothetical protein [Clostridium cuniculi]